MWHASFALAWFRVEIKIFVKNRFFYPCKAEYGVVEIDLVFNVLLSWSIDSFKLMQYFTVGDAINNIEYVRYFIAGNASEQINTKKNVLSLENQFGISL